MRKFFSNIKQSFSEMQTATKFVVAAVVATTLFTIACFIILAITGINIADALVVAFFSFWTVEIVSLASIKNTKTKKGAKKKPKEPKDGE